MRIGGGDKGRGLALAVLRGGEGAGVVEVAVKCRRLSMRGGARWRRNRLHHLHLAWVPGGEHVLYSMGNVQVWCTRMGVGTPRGMRTTDT